MDTSTALGKQRPSPITRRYLFVAYGIAIAAGSWWLIEELLNQRFLDLGRAESALVPLIGLTLVALVATIALLPSPIALLAASATTAAGIVLGGYGSRSPLVTLPNNDLQFTLLRGAYEPGIWILGVLWAIIAFTRLRATSARAT